LFGRARDSPPWKTWLRPVPLNAFTEQVGLQVHLGRGRLFCLNCTTWTLIRTGRQANDSDETVWAHVLLFIIAYRQCTLNTIKIKPNAAALFYKVTTVSL